MKNGLSLLPAVLVLALLGASVASAGSSTAPTPGSYKGPAKSTGYEGYVETGPAEAKVSRAGGGASISLELYGQLDCGSDEGHILQVTVSAKTAGNTFSHVGTTEEPNGNLFHYQVKGMFTKPTSFKGTLKATGEVESLGPEKDKCTADIDFTLYRAKS